MRWCLQLIPSISRKRSVADDTWQLMVPASLVEPPSCASEHPTTGVGKPAEKTMTPSPGVGAMLMTPIPRIDPSDDTRECPAGASTSESMVIEIARLVAAAVHDDADLCELQVRFEGQIQEGR